MKWNEILFTAGLLISLGCNTQQDKQIKADINSQAKGNLNFAGIKYIVHNGVVTVFGTCPSDKNKQIVLETIKGIHIVKQTRDKINVAKVTLGHEQQFKESVDSVLVNYPLVTADVNEKRIMLLGFIKEQEVDQLLNALKVFEMPIEKEALTFL